MWIRFVVFGVFGWCTEIVWTSGTDAVAAAAGRRPFDAKLTGKTYIWMFPIYAFGGLLFEVAHGLIAFLPWFGRGLVYMVGCFLVEYVAGWLIKVLTGAIPWDYSDQRWHVHGLIRLDYAPAWFVFGLLLEVVERVARAIEPAIAGLL